MGGTARSDASPTPEAHAAASNTLPHDPQAMLQVFLDYLPSGVTLFGPDLQIIACNAKLQRSCFRFFGD